MRITNNVYIVSGESYGALGEVYAIRTDRGVILVDCGAPDVGLMNIKENLSNFGLADLPITHVILTHGHWDHCGCAKALKDESAKIMVGAEDAFMCKNGGNVGLETPYDGEEHVYPAFTPDIEITEDTQIELNGLLIKIIKIPGHTAGSIAVLSTVDQSTFLFTGDALQPGGAYHTDSVSFGWQGDINFSRADIVSSMHKLMRTVKTDCILPGHGTVCLKNADMVLRKSAQIAFNSMR